MPLPKIIHGSEPITVERLRVLIYGQPGTGKTSLAFSCSNPLLLDFDEGAHRSAFRQDSVPIASWGEVGQITAEDLEPYDTVIIDTVGRALDFLAAYIKANDPKMGNRAGALTLQGYGALKAGFASWLSTLASLGKDVVLIAHDKEDKRGDDMIVRPDIQGGSYNELFKLADAVGYLSIVNKRRVIDFNPTEAYVGKNPAGTAPMQIPDLSTSPQWFAEFIQSAKDSIGAISAESQKLAERVADYRAKLDEITDAEGMNALLGSVGGEPRAVSAPIKKLMHDKLPAIAVVFDQEQGAFIDVTTDEATENAA